MLSVRIPLTRAIGYFLFVLLKSLILYCNNAVSRQRKVMIIMNDDNDYDYLEGDNGNGSNDDDYKYKYGNVNQLTQK